MTDIGPICPLARSRQPVITDALALGVDGILSVQDTIGDLQAMRRLCVLICILAAAIGLRAQTTNPDRGGTAAGGHDRATKHHVVDSGVVGGIPDVTTQCGTTIAPPSSAAAINAAIQACNNGFVSLAAGTFNIGDGGIVMKTGVVLRGQGMSTILNMTGTVGSAHWYWGGGACSLVFTGGYLNLCRRSRSYLRSRRSECDHGLDRHGRTNGHLHTGSDGGECRHGSAGLSVGDMLVFWQSDPADASVPNAGLFFSDETSSAGISWQGSYDDANSAMEQRSRVTAINGTAVTIAEGLAHPSYLWQSALNPRAGWLTQAQMIHDSGLENLRISSTSQGQHQCDIGVAWGYNIWVRGVGMTPHFTGFHQGGAVDFGFIAEDSNHVSFVNNWIDKMIGGGIDTTTSYGVAFKETHHFRVENNIFNNVESPTELLIGSMGGVIAYNYERYVGTEQQEGGLQQHEVASAMNLIEGNTYMKVFMDVFHGNSGVSTYFRNYLTTRGFDLWSYHRCHNIIGNAITASQVRKTLVTDATKRDRYYNYGFRLGYPQDGASAASLSNPGTVAADSRVIDTTMLWGNYTSTGGSVFDPAEVPSSDPTCPNPVPSSQTLPASLYLSARPGYFTVSGIGTQPWPLNGPDVTNGVFLSGHANKTPAQLVYEAAGGNVANFNPGLYGASSANLPAPANLRVAP